MREEKAVVVLAATMDLAIRRGRQLRKNSWDRIIPITGRQHLYDLYGRSGMPFDIVPGTPLLDWHKEINHHVTYGRLVPVRQFRIRYFLCDRCGDRLKGHDDAVCAIKVADAVFADV